MPEQENNIAQNPAPTEKALRANQDQPQITQPDPDQKTQDLKQPEQPLAANKDVFVLCDQTSKPAQQCLTFLKAHNINPVYINDKKYLNLSLDQICFSNPQIKFAIIVLSAAEMAYPKEGKPANAKLKTPQAMVFALGFFLGKFGRQNVFVFYQEQKNFILPTAYHHMLYTPLDTKDLWQKELASRLKNSGYKL